MLASLAFSLALVGSALGLATTPSINKRASPAAFSTFTQNPVFYPAESAPLWRTAYARAIQVQSGNLLLTWENYPPGQSSSNLDTFIIMESTTGGATWQNLSQVHDTQNGWGMRFQPHMYITKSAYGNYPAGTLLIAGVSCPESLDGGVYIDLYSSSNQGSSWSFVSHVAYGEGPETVTTGNAAIWEPFMLEYGGELLIYFSDQRDSGYSQKLSMVSSSNLVNWSGSQNVVTHASTARPGMAVISYLTSTKEYFLSYEYCDSPSGSGCPATYRLASNPNDFLSAPDTTLTTTSGYTPGGSPYSVWYSPTSAGTTGELILSTNSDTDLFVSHDNAQTWTEVNVNQYTGQSRHLLLFDDDGTERLHLCTAGFYGCSGSCYNYVANGVTALSAFSS